MIHYLEQTHEHRMSYINMTDRGNYYHPYTWSTFIFPHIYTNTNPHVCGMPPHIKFPVSSFTHSSPCNVVNPKITTYMEVIIPSPATGLGVLDMASKYSAPCKSSRAEDYNNSGEFAFCSSGQLHSVSVSADVLFDGGIKPLKIPSLSQYQHIATTSPESPRSPKRMLARAVLMALRHRKRYYNDYPLLTKAKREQEEASNLTLFKLVSMRNLVKQSSIDTIPSLSSSSNSSSKWKITESLMFRGSSTGRLSQTRMIVRLQWNVKIKDMYSQRYS